MNEIQGWIEEKQQGWPYDFLGIALNTSAAYDAKEIRWLYVAGNKSDAYRKIRLHVGHGIAGLVWKTARMQEAKAILEHPQIFADYPIARLERLTTVLAVPVLQEHEVIAVLACGYRDDSVFAFDDRTRLTQAAIDLSKLLE
ncbi:hypothetical protein A5886_000406 [Enterococcus sp. 8G7_MSG3316]|uniref:GAF domain-containing protein n=1 Tax=Candidatus Enterococcus testudinis TaxID=1834191 RepID=A0A242A2S5_9ENTE|nr:hypothetical protein [Enterococcus sp. 8G7_MSG3316]OTN75336.1 hypothetical protein A5886_000406 [Enterococcus sp. 8G7_MSG3316]